MSEGSDRRQGWPFASTVIIPLSGVDAGVDADVDAGVDAGADFRTAQNALRMVSHRILPFVTWKGRLSIRSMDINKGDVIAPVSGAQKPFVLRRVDRRSMIVTEAYIDSLIDGEAAEDV